MKGKIVTLFLILAMLLVLFVPASAASKPEVELFPLKAVTVRVRMLGCETLYPTRTGCSPLNNAYWQFRVINEDLSPTSSSWLPGYGTNADGWGSVTFYPDHRWTGYVQCMGYSYYVTSARILGTTSVTVQCDPLYSKNP